MNFEDRDHLSIFSELSEKYSSFCEIINDSHKNLEGNRLQKELLCLCEAFRLKIENCELNLDNDLERKINDFWDANIEKVIEFLADKFHAYPCDTDVEEEMLKRWNSLDKD